MNRHTRWPHLSQHNRDKIIVIVCFIGIAIWALGVKFL